MTLAARLAIFSLAIVPMFAQRRPVDRAAVERSMKELSNWGRWGAADQKGTMNPITPATRVRAAAPVKDGFAVSLSRDMDTLNPIAVF